MQDVPEENILMCHEPSQTSNHHDHITPNSIGNGDKVCGEDTLEFGLELIGSGQRVEVPTLPSGKESHLKIDMSAVTLEYDFGREVDNMIEVMVRSGMTEEDKIRQLVLCAAKTAVDRFCAKRKMYAQ